MALDRKFSREAFLRSDAHQALARELAEAIKARLIAAVDPVSEEQRCMQELIALGHPLREFRWEGDATEGAGEWFDDWEKGEGGAPGDLMVTTMYWRAWPAQVEVLFTQPERGQLSA